MLCGCMHADVPLLFIGLETALLGAEGRTIGMAAECLAAAMMLYDGGGGYPMLRHLCGIGQCCRCAVLSRVGEKS